MDGKTALASISSCPIGYVAESTMLGHLSTASLGLKTDSAYANLGTARTNPSRPDIDIPVFIGELKDLPSLVKDAGGGLIKMMARQHLRTHFGTVPLMRDLLSMCNFVRLAELRLTELKALKERGLGRTRELDNLSLTESKEITPNSNGGAVLAGRLTQTTSVRVWTHVKWFPTAEFPKTDASLLRLAYRASLGLTLDASTAWELIPFSWLVDWFTGIGSFLNATRNIVPCSSSTPLVMRHTKTESSIIMSGRNGHMPSTFSVSDYHSTYETKDRKPTALSPFTAYVPFLSGRQLAVLGSLAVVKHGRYF